MTKLYVDLFARRFDMPFDPSQITLEADAREFIRRYDARCKRILSNRMVLAHLLRATMDEFAGMEAEEIATRYIEGIPGKENDSQRILGLRNERDNPNRNSSFYDVIFYALNPGTGDAIPIIINVEAQADSSPGYDLTNRGVFYLGCMIADQKDTVFQNDRYDDLRKVCSIWICTDPPKDHADSIECYTLDQHVIQGKPRPHRVDKLRLVIVYLSREVDKNSAKTDGNDNLGIIPLLNACLAKTVNKERQELITDRYRIQLDPEDRDMTAGEQIIYKHYREMWELGEQIKELGEQNRFQGKQIKEQDEQIKELGEQNKALIENVKNTAKLLKDAQVPVDVIAKSTGLTVEQIEAL